MGLCVQNWGLRAGIMGKIELIMTCLKGQERQAFGGGMGVKCGKEFDKWKGKRGRGFNGEKR